MAAVEKQGIVLSQALARALLAALDGREVATTAVAWDRVPEKALEPETGADAEGFLAPHPFTEEDSFAQGPFGERDWTELELALGQNAMRGRAAKGRLYGGGADEAAFERADEDRLYGDGANAAAFGWSAEERPYDVGAAKTGFWQTEGRIMQPALPAAPPAGAARGQSLPPSVLAMARFEALDARALSRQFERDARRYDGA